MLYCKYRVSHKISHIYDARKKHGKAPNPPTIAMLKTELQDATAVAGQNLLFYMAYLSLCTCISRIECCQCNVYFNVVADDILLLNIGLSVMS